MTKSTFVPPSDPNVVTKTTTFREVMPAGSERTPTHSISTDFFNFVRNISDLKQGEYMIYLYRVEPNRVQVDHTPGKTFDVPGIGLVPVIDQEAIETAVSQDCGGGVYRLMCNKRSSGEMQAQQVFRIDLPPRQITPWFVKRGENSKDGKPVAYGGDPAAQIAAKAMDTISTEKHEAVNIGLELFRQGANAIAAAREPHNDDFQKQFMTVMLERALNPPDPLAQLSRLKDFMGMSNGGAFGGGGDFWSNLDKLRSVVGFFSGSGNTAPVSTGAAMVQAVPMMISQVVDGIRELRVKAEIERDTAAITHRMVPPQRAPAPGPMPPPQPQVLAPAIPMQNGEPTFDFLGQKVVEILRLPISAEEAAERTLDFLETLSGENPPPEKDWVIQFASLGEPGLVQMFQLQPSLKPATANTARLAEFIRAFLRLHAEDVARDQAEQRRPN